MIPLVTNINEPHKAPIRLFSIQAKTRNIAISFFVRILIFTLKYAKAARGITTCHRSASDHTTFSEKGISASIPAPIMQPRYAENAPHIPYHMANTTINATAKYMLETPGAGDIGELITANLDKSELTSTRNRKIFKYVENDSISGMMSSPLISGMMY
nr:hypothetical protein [uncultured Methanolobus sp.]